MKEFQGISASLGIGIGVPYVLPEEVHTMLPRHAIRRDQVEEGWKRFEFALEKAKKDITELSDSVNGEQKSIFDTHVMMLCDPDFIFLIKDRYETTLMNIEYVVSAQIGEFVENLRQAGDSYLMLRAADIEDVYGRVLSYLEGSRIPRTEGIPAGAVLVARNIKPSEAVILRERSLAGILLEEGGTNSHVAILARSYGVPAVMGVPGITKAMRGAKMVVIDGKTGCVIVNPAAAVLAEYSKQGGEEKMRRKRLSVYKDKDASTADGVPITLLANIGIPEDVAVARTEGAQGIGLFRSEFLFMRSSDLVSEEMQFTAYKSALAEMQGRSVVIRTLDAGGDKLIAGQNESDEKNPLLGWRAIRFCLGQKDIFKTQLRALLRASVYGKLKIMFPLITGCDELEEALSIADEVKEELRGKNIPFDENVPFGTMIETPSAALISDLLAEKCSFFSIGTNDLTQYTIAVDRENRKVNGLFNEFHPAVLRLIGQTIAGARKAGIPVSVCGEVAGRPEGVLLLAGMGIRSFSMSANSLSVVKETLADYTIAELEDIALRVLQFRTGGQVCSFLSDTLHLHSSRN